MPKNITSDQKLSIIKYAEMGLKTKEIAKLLDMTDRSVRKYKYIKKKDIPKKTPKTTCNHCGKTISKVTNRQYCDSGHKNSCQHKHTKNIRTKDEAMIYHSHKVKLAQKDQK